MFVHWRKEKGASSQKLKEEKKNSLLSWLERRKMLTQTKQKKTQSEQVKMRKTNISKDGNTTDRCKTGYLTQKTKRKQK